jgi:hypothetical protein
MAGALDRPVHLAWGGLIAMTATIFFVAAVRGPVFPEADKPRAAASGTSSGEDDPSGSSAGPTKGGPSVAPSGSAKAGSWGLPDLPGLKDDKPPSVTPGPDEREAVKTFLDRVRKNDLKGSVAALEALAAEHPGAIKDAEVKEEIVELSQRVMQTQGDLPDRMFDVLARKSGTTGIDILYYLVTSKGGSKASKVADRLLADPKIVARGSEAMRIAWELRKATCEAKKPLFPRAGEHGDQRTLGQLFLLNQSCGRRNRGCCLHKDPGLEAAIDKLKERGYR